MSPLWRLPQIEASRHTQPAILVLSHQLSAATPKTTSITQPPLDHHPRKLRIDALGTTQGCLRALTAFMLTKAPRGDGKKRQWAARPYLQQSPQRARRLAEKIICPVNGGCRSGRRDLLPSQRRRPLRKADLHPKTWSRRKGIQGTKFLSAEKIFFRSSSQHLVAPPTGHPGHQTPLRREHLLPSQQWRRPLVGYWRPIAP